MSRLIPHTRSPRLVGRRVIVGFIIINKTGILGKGQPNNWKPLF